MFLQYTIDSGTNFQLNKMLPIQFEATITKMDNFRGAAIEDNNYILVLDNDNTIDTEDKTSIIHLFLVKDFAV